MPLSWDESTSPAPSRVAIGGAGWRAGVLRRAREAAAPGVRVIELPAPRRPWPPWQGLADYVAAMSGAASVLAPSHAAALEAASTGRFSGDHVGAGADLRGLFAATALDGPVLLLVPDAHRLDFASAAALSVACADLSGLEVSVLVTQAPSSRGVSGLDTVVEAGPGPGCEGGDELVVDPADRLREARQRHSLLDAADALEALGDWAAAAEHWLSGGRPDRARRALGLAPDDVSRPRRPGPPGAQHRELASGHRCRHDRSSRVGCRSRPGRPPPPAAGPWSAQPGPGPAGGGPARRRPSRPGGLDADPGHHPGARPRGGGRGVCRAHEGRGTGDDAGGVRAAPGPTG